jgi:hypothetical protein
VEKLELNQPLADDQFELKVPQDYKLQTIK